MSYTRTLLIGSLVAALSLGACGKQSSSDNSEATSNAAKPAVDKPGPVITLDNGIRYTELRAGNGRVPGPEDYVTLHYRAYKQDGTPIADSRQAGPPPTYLLKDTLPGWQSALSHMHEGSVWRVTIPPKLAYGEKGLGDVIGPNEFGHLRAIADPGRNSGPVAGAPR